MKFIFVRHGEATHNKEFNDRGCNDYKVFSEEAFRDAPLTEKGIKQARKTGERMALELKDIQIEAIWSSPLTRCIQTAEEIFEEMDVVSCVLHDNLLEGQGNKQCSNERKSKKDIQNQFNIWKTEYISDIPAVWSSSESIYTMRHRMFMICHLLHDLYANDGPNAGVIIVSHHNVIESLVGRSLSNAEFVVYDGLSAFY
jgi:probable phosphoglycerate mutase